MADARRKKILVVDDEEDVRTYLKALFEEAGYEVVTAEDGEEGLERLRAESPDLVTLDLQMPEETGTGLYRHMARDKVLREIPVIVISGLAGRDLAVRKPVAVFDKPVDTAELLRVVAGTLGGA